MHSSHVDTEIEKRNINIFPHRFQITAGNDSLSLIMNMVMCNSKTVEDIRQTHPDIEVAPLSG